VRVAHAHRGIDVHEAGFLLTLICELDIEPNYARSLMVQVKAESRR
jgi:hypothetical protein